MTNAIQNSLDHIRQMEETKSVSFFLFVLFYLNTRNNVMKTKTIFTHLNFYFNLKRYKKHF